MKTLRDLIGIFFLVFLCQFAFAQQQMEDVVYLKDGSIYRGLIIEQVPNESLKVQIMGGSVMAISMKDVLKMTKEEPFAQQGRRAPATVKEPRSARVKVPFEARTKGYFFQGQLLLEAQQFGLRVVNGYKFGRFGHLGIGVGFDGVGGSPWNGRVNGLGTNELSGVYLPLYLYYAGDILKTKVTPFYMVEAGYAHPLNGPVIQEDYGYSAYAERGGAMGALGLGVRFNTSRRINFSLLMNVNFKNVQYSRNYYLYDDVLSTYDYYSEVGNATLIMAGLRFGIAF